MIFLLNYLISIKQGIWVAKFSWIHNAFTSQPVVKEKNDGEEGSKKQVFGEENSGEGRKEKIDREEGCKEQGFQEEYHNEEGKKVRRKAFNKKKRQKEGIVFQGEEIVKEKGTRERVRKDQIVSIPIEVAILSSCLTLIL